MTHQRFEMYKTAIVLEKRQGVAAPDFLAKPTPPSRKIISGKSPTPPISIYTAKCFVFNTLHNINLGISVRNNKCFSSQNQVFLAGMIKKCHFSSENHILDK